MRTLCRSCWTGILRKTQVRQLRVFLQIHGLCGQSAAHAPATRHRQTAQPRSLQARHQRQPTNAPGGPASMSSLLVGSLELTSSPDTERQLQNTDERARRETDEEHPADLQTRPEYLLTSALPGEQQATLSGPQAIGTGHKLVPFWLSPGRRISLQRPTWAAASPAGFRLGFDHQVSTYATLKPGAMVSGQEWSCLERKTLPCSGPFLPDAAGSSRVHWTHRPHMLITHPYSGYVAITCDGADHCPTTHSLIIASLHNLTLRPPCSPQPPSAAQRHAPMDQPACKHCCTFQDWSPMLVHQVWQLAHDGNSPQGVWPCEM